MLIFNLWFQEAVVGETLFASETERDLVKTFAEIKEIKPTVYAGLFPVETSDYESLKQAVERLCLNDPSVSVTPDSSKALGLGWRVSNLSKLFLNR